MQTTHAVAGDTQEVAVDLEDTPVILAHGEMLEVEIRFAGQAHGNLLGLVTMPSEGRRAVTKVRILVTSEPF
jgi:hypothetical protein